MVPVELQMDGPFGVQQHSPLETGVIEPIVTQIHIQCLIGRPREVESVGRYVVYPLVTEIQVPQTVQVVESVVADRADEARVSAECVEVEVIKPVVGARYLAKRYRRNGGQLIPI